jgi:hypothetical protein
MGIFLKSPLDFKKNFRLFLWLSRLLSKNIYFFRLSSKKSSHAVRQFFCLVCVGAGGVVCVFGESIFDEIFCFVVRAVIEESLLSIQRGQASNIFFFKVF